MEQPMTLSERLRNPAYVANPMGGDALLDVARTLDDMRQAADIIDQSGWKGCTDLDCIPGCEHSLDHPHCERFAQWQRDNE